MPERTEIPKTLLVVIALRELGGDADLEHIAVKAHELFPEQFCWRSFPQFPDKDAVRVHLSEAKKAAFGGLVADVDLRTQRRGSKGYSKRFVLTARGTERAEEVRALLGFHVGVTAKRNSLDFKRVVEPILDSPAYAQYVNGGNFTLIGRDAFLAAFRVFPDAPTMLVSGRLSRAASVVQSLPESRQKDSLTRFIKDGRHAYGI
jgi:hypothetical protein